MKLGMSKSSDEHKPARALWFWLAVAATALLLAALLYSGTFRHFVDVATDWAKDLMNAHPVPGALIFFGFSALSAMLAFASSVVLVPPANLAWGKAITFLLLWGGWLAGAAAAYRIGRLARPLLIHVGYGHKLQQYQEFVSKRIVLGGAAAVHCGAFRVAGLPVRRRALPIREVHRCDGDRRSDLRARRNDRRGNPARCEAFAAARGNRYSDRHRGNRRAVAANAQQTQVASRVALLMLSMSRSTTSTRGDELESFKGPRTRGIEDEGPRLR